MSIPDQMWRALMGQQVTKSAALMDMQGDPDWMNPDVPLHGENYAAFFNRSLKIKLGQYDVPVAGPEGERVPYQKQAADDPPADEKKITEHYYIPGMAPGRVDYPRSTTEAVLQGMATGTSEGVLAATGLHLLKSPHLLHIPGLKLPHPLVAMAGLPVAHGLQRGIEYTLNANSQAAYRKLYPPTPDPKPYDQPAVEKTASIMEGMKWDPDQLKAFTEAGRNNYQWLMAMKAKRLAAKSAAAEPPLRRIARERIEKQAMYGNLSLSTGTSGVMTRLPQTVPGSFFAESGSLFTPGAVTPVMGGPNVSTQALNLTPEIAVGENPDA